MPIAFLLLLILTALSAYAADYTAGTKCPAKVNHQPLKNLEYQAGVDAKGYAVAPADLQPAPITKEDLETVRLPLSVPVTDYTTQDQLNVNTEELNLDVGQAAVNTKTGQVAFNGKEITTMESTLSDPDCW